MCPHGLFFWQSPFVNTLLTFFGPTSISLPCNEDLGLTVVKGHEINGLDQFFIADTSVSFRDAPASEPMSHDALLDFGMNT